MRAEPRQGVTLRTVRRAVELDADMFFRVAAERGVGKADEVTEYRDERGILAGQPLQLGPVT
jgi:hypothetical protein